MEPGLGVLCSARGGGCVPVAPPVTRESSVVERSPLVKQNPSTACCRVSCVSRVSAAVALCTRFSGTRRSDPLPLLSLGRRPATPPAPALGLAVVVVRTLAGLIIRLDPTAHRQLPQNTREPRLVYVPGVAGARKSCEVRYRKDHRNRGDTF